MPYPEPTSDAMQNFAATSEDQASLQISREPLRSSPSRERKSIKQGQAHQQQEQRSPKGEIPGNYFSREQQLQKTYELQQGVSSSFSGSGKAKGRQQLPLASGHTDIYTKRVKEDTALGQKLHRQGTKEFPEIDSSYLREIKIKKSGSQEQKPYELQQRISSSFTASENNNNAKRVIPQRQPNENHTDRVKEESIQAGQKIQKQRPNEVAEKYVARDSKDLQQSGPPRRERPNELTASAAVRIRDMQDQQKPRRQRPQQQQQARKSQQNSRKNNEQGKTFSNPKALKSAKSSGRDPVAHQYSKSRENARSMQQEQQDKRRKEQYKKNRGAAKRSETKYSRQSGKPGGCCLFFELFVDTTCNLICIGVVIVIAVVCGVIIYKLKTGKDAPVVPGVVNDIADGAITNFEDLLFKKGLVDHWQSNGTGEFPTSTWSHSGNGLKLEVYNALTSDWYPYFTAAMNDWANGHSPTSLVLPIVQVDADPTCTPITGVLKVCNADFGETGWKGINEVAINGLNKIVQSVAKMNEYYLSGAADGDKQYTMCHETGHGWGLGHQDEDFNNADLGTCMDYVLDPQNNQHPNQKDYEILNEVYGAVQSRNRDRERRTLHLRSNEKFEQKKMLNPRFNISFTDERHRHKWRLLRRMRGMETHELDLGEGNKMRAHVLLSNFQGNNTARKL